ncbi:MAG: 50S ribosomal protein L4 [Mycoplasmatales bacterium]
MASIDVLGFDGNKTSTIELNDTIFGIEPNQNAIYDAVIMQRASLRQGTHAVKDRSQVSGGGRKPWRQKGTGRARHGSIRSPQWKGGGIVFGPTPRSYSYKINKKVRRLALKSVIAEKFQAGDLIVIENLAFDTPKTKQITQLFANINVDRKPLLTTSQYDENVFLSTRNIPGALNLDVEGLNVLDIVNAHKLILTQDAVAKLEEVFA